MPADKVIVFGPSGNVGSFTAIAAAKHGSKVYLAMRDTSKPLPDIEADTNGSYERIQADLSKPETVIAAVKSSGAKRAFIYLVHGSKDHMKAGIEAIKKGGIEFVVFLSSADVTGDPADEKSEDIIPFLHAQVELNLRATFGTNGYAAIRPGAFAVNAATWWSQGIKQGEVRMFAQNARLDWVTPEDMGGVAGAVLAGGLKTESPVFVIGPQKLSLVEAFEIVKKEAPLSDVKLTFIDKKAAEEDMIKQHIPPPIAKYLADGMEKQSTMGVEHIPDDMAKTGRENVVEYTGGSGLKFEEWVRRNKNLFTQC